MAESYDYVKLVDGERKTVSTYTIDNDGSITGHIVVNVKAWFDENPEERKRLGWIKHIHPDRKLLDYNPQTEYIVTTTRQIDAFTVTDEFHILPKTEEMFVLEELLDSIGGWYDSRTADDDALTFGGMHFF